jgi:hypothetical protein
VPQKERIRRRNQAALLLVEARENGGIFFLEIVLAYHRRNIARYFSTLFKLFINGPLGIAIHGVTALGEPSRIGGIPHRRQGSRGHVCQTASEHCLLWCGVNPTLSICVTPRM